MTAVIREDEFSRFFDLIIDLWPSELTLDIVDSNSISRSDDSWLQGTYMAVRAELNGNVEDWDLQVSSTITAAIYKFLCLKSETEFGTKVPRNCIDKIAVMNLVDQYKMWAVLRNGEGKGRYYPR
jgi:hypothetical protein